MATHAVWLLTQFIPSKSVRVEDPIKEEVTPSDCSIHVSTKMTRSLNELMFYGLLICYKQRELALLVIITESYNIDIYMYMEFDVIWTRPKQNTLSINFNMTTFVFLF